MSTKKIVYVDMDDTICDYTSNFWKYKKENPSVVYPQSILGFYKNILPIEGAIDSVKKINENYNLYFATRPSYMNLHCYSEKAEWIANHFGIHWVSKLILIPDKSLLIGDYLIDDYPWKNFKGEWIRYENNWNVILQKLKC